VLGVGLDNYNAAHIQNWLAKKRVEVTEIPMTVKNLSEPMKEIQAQTYAGNYKNPGDSLHSWCVSNVVCRVDANGNIFPRKENDEDKIDPAVADIFNMALHLAKPIKKKKKRKAKIRVVRG
jgi:phage terminase large subunit-like protein